MLAVNEALDGPLDGDAVARLYERVMDEARRIQRIEAERTTESEIRNKELEITNNKKEEGISGNSSAGTNPNTLE